MGLRLKIAVLCLLWLPLAAAAEELGTWQARGEGGRHYASVETARGLTVIISFETGKPGAQMFVSGLWKTRPLDLRLYVSYADGKRAYIDTFRFAKMLKTDGGATAYTLTMPTAQLRPLRGGDTLVIEDLTKRVTVPLTGSAKAITSAQKSAAGG